MIQIGDLDSGAPTMTVGSVTTDTVAMYPAQVAQPCPSCGCCPMCGRKAAPLYPSYPIGPWYPSPWWQAPYPYQPLITWTVVNTY